MPLSPGKLQRLRSLSTASGIIAAAAMDQRGSLAKSIAAARGVDKREVLPAMMSEFKTAVTRILTPHASAILLDPDYGLPAIQARAANCGLLLAYELSGYDNTRPGRFPDLIPNVSVKRIRDCGADGVKLLVYYNPFEESKINDAKRAFVERTGAECAAHDVPFFLELVGYSLDGGGEKSEDYLRQKPRIVIGSVEEFSKPQYMADVLKVEVPVNGQVYSHSEAVKFFKEASDAASKPFIYLSAGVDNDVFVEQLQTAGEAGAQFSGVLCGRATWKTGIPVYAREGLAAFENWLATEGVSNINKVNGALRGARPWWEQMGLGEPDAA